MQTSILVAYFCYIVSDLLVQEKKDWSSAYCSSAEGYILSTIFFPVNIYQLMIKQPSEALSKVNGKNMKILLDKKFESCLYILFEKYIWLL